MTPIADLSRIECSTFIKAPRSRVWRAITNMAEFSAWFQVKAEGEFAPGARIRMTSLHPCGANAVFHVTVDEIRPEESFSWRWHPGAERPAEESDEPMTRVEFRLTDEDGGTRVTVTESGFDQLSLERRAKAFKDNSNGWTMQMQALET